MGIFAILMLACGQQPFEANNADVVDTETMKKN